MTMPRQIWEHRWWMRQPVIDDAAQSHRRLSTLLAQLPNAVSLANPPLEPDTLTLPTHRQRSPDQCATTIAAPPTLLATARVPMTSETNTAAPRTLLFESSLNHLRQNRHNALNSK
jgi:hypothetical protein